MEQTERSATLSTFHIQIVKDKCDVPFLCLKMFVRIMELTMESQMRKISMFVFVFFIILFFYYFLLFLFLLVPSTLFSVVVVFLGHAC